MLEKLRKLIQKSQFQKELKKSLGRESTRDEAAGRLLAHETFSRLFMTLPKNVMDSVQTEEEQEEGADIEMESEKDTLERVKDYLENTAEEEINANLLNYIVRCNNTNSVDSRIERVTFYQLEEQDALLKKAKKILEAN